MDVFTDPTLPLQSRRAFHRCTESFYSADMEFFNDAGDDPLKPTLFELVAQEQLRDLLQPALKYVLSVSGHRSI